MYIQDLSLTAPPEARPKFIGIAYGALHKLAERYGELAKELGVLEEDGIFVLSGKEFSNTIAHRFVKELAEKNPKVFVCSNIYKIYSADMGNLLSLRKNIEPLMQTEYPPRTVMSIGGGSVVDVGKKISENYGLVHIAIPTNAAHDGITHGASVIADGDPWSKISKIPDAVIEDLGIIAGAPKIYTDSGGLELIGKISSAMDGFGYADYDPIPSVTRQRCEYSRDLAILAIELAKQTDLRLQLKNLVEGLNGSGINMNMYGVQSGQPNESSRPASGAEHQIAYALQESLQGTLTHGMSVGVGTLARAILQKKYTGESLFGFEAGDIAEIYRLMGVKEFYGYSTLNENKIHEALMGAHTKRPNRFTIIKEANDIGWLTSDRTRDIAESTFRLLKYNH